MKKSKYIFVILFVLFSVTLCYSQNFKAKDGLNPAKNKANLSNPELMLCATINGTIPGVPITLAFDINTGNATAWLYVIRSADDNNIKKSIIVGKLFNNFVTYDIEVNQIVDSLPFEPAGSLNDIQWIDSDVMANNLKNYQDYKDYLNAHSDATISLVTLSYNGDYPYIPIGSTYWIAKIDAAGTTSLVCAVNAINGDVICFDEPSAVEENEIGNYKLNIYPNPASDNIFIILPDGLSTSNNELQIFDSEGKLAYNFNVKPVVGVNLISIPVKLFSSGQYIVNITTAKGVITGKFIID